MKATTCIISPLNSSKNKEEMPAYTYFERRLHNVNLPTIGRQVGKPQT
jgi:hypothetical protein